LVPDAWKRAVATELNEEPGSLFLSPYYEVISDTFLAQNLFLPPQGSWKTIKAQIFSIIDGKKLLFEDQDSLFNQIKSIGHKALKITRLSVASAMLPEEIHEHVDQFFANLEIITNQADR
jgi:hypothetical protein